MIKRKSGRPLTDKSKLMKASKENKEMNSITEERNAQPDVKIPEATATGIPIQQKARTPFHLLSEEEQNRIMARRKESKPINDYNAFGIDERKFDKENYMYEIVNDDPEKDHIEIDKKIKAGWTLVDDNGGDMESPDKRSGSATQLGSNVSRSVGNGVIGRLMRLPKKLWDIDEQERRGTIDKVEEGMKRKKREASDPDEKGTYGEVSIKQKSRL